MKFAKFLIDRRVNGTTRDGHPCHMVLPLKFDADGISIEIIQCSVISTNVGCSLIKINDNEDKYETIVKNNKSAQNYYGEYSLAKVGKGQYLASVMNNNCALARIVSESGVFLTSAKPITDDIIEWAILAPNAAYVKNFIKRVTDLGYTINRKYVTDPEAEMKLTARQEEIITYALKIGYYDVPKKINVDDICKEFGCSKSTVNVIMRTAEKKIIEHYMEPYQVKDVHE
jgi:predicted DNA binding protein